MSFLKTIITFTKAMETLLAEASSNSNLTKNQIALEFLN